VPGETSNRASSEPSRATSRMGGNRYGKDGVRLVTVRRHPDRHELRDLTLDLRLAGDFAEVYTAGDNSPVLPTDTMRSTVYALAREHLTGDIELFGRALAERLLRATPAARSAEVSIAEHTWARVPVGGVPHPHTFVGAGDERATATVTVDRDGSATARSGIAGLLVLKTTGSSFTGFRRDEYTVLADADDRILATELAARWEYRPAWPETGFGGCRQAVRQVLLEAFAGHDDSRSVQHTLYVLGDAVLAARPEIERITFTLPNRHHVAADLSPFGQDNEGEVYVATDRPFGVIEGTVERPG
jgi:urate oxidase